MSGGITVNDLRQDITGWHDDITELALQTLAFLYKKRETLNSRVPFYAYIKSLVNDNNSFLGESHKSMSNLSKQCLSFYSDIYKQYKGIGIDFNDKDSFEVDAYNYIVDNFKYKHWTPDNTTDDFDRIYIATKIALGIYSLGNPGIKENKNNYFLEYLISEEGSEFFKIAGFAMNKIVILVAYIISDSSTKNIAGTNCDGDNIDMAISTWKPIINYLFQLASFFMYRTDKILFNVDNDVKEACEKYVNNLVRVCNTARTSTNGFTLGEFMRQFKATMPEQDRAICKDILSSRTTTKQTNDLSLFNSKPFEYTFQDERPAAAFSFLEYYLKFVEDPGRIANSNDRGQARRHCTWRNDGLSSSRRDDGLSSSRRDDGRGSSRRDDGRGDNILMEGNNNSSTRRNVRHPQTASAFLETFAVNKGGRSSNMISRSSRDNVRIPSTTNQSPSVDAFLKTTGNY